MITRSDTAPVVVEGLCKRFGKGETRVTALQDVSFAVGSGEFVAIMGASGSGKSTLLHLIAGLTAPDSGRVMVDGEDIAGMSDRRLSRFRRERIGLVFQSYNLVPTFTAEDNLMLPLLLGGRKKQAQADGKLDELLHLLGMQDRRKHRPGELSGGEQQRIAIGRALITDPAVMLADEPTGNLDSANGAKICELLRNLSAEKSRTILMVTHDPNVAAFAQRILILKDGRILLELKASDYRNAMELGAHYQELVAAS